MSHLSFIKSIGVFLLAVTIAGLPATAHAQSEGAAGDDFSFFVGSMLPNQIEGVTEILPVFGGRYGLWTSAGTIEFGGSNTHAYGVDFSTIDLSLRGDVPLGVGLTGFVSGGVDFNYYIPEGESQRRSETGIHMGAGGMLLVSDTFWLRGELKMMGGPGTSLFLLFGLVFRTSDVGSI